MGQIIEVTKYQLSEEDFARFRSLIERVSGVYYDGGKKPNLRAVLFDRAQATGAASISEYYQQLTSAPDREMELRRLLDLLAVPDTRFFRNLPQFDAFRSYIIPELVRRKAAGPRKLRIWCAGCSTGQEAYSIAMSLLDVLPRPDSWQLEILATDLSEQALAVAQRGRYGEDQLEGIDRLHLEKYFRHHDHAFLVAEPVKRMVRFLRHNLVTDLLPLSTFGACDVVFCRNVVVYFSHATAKFVIDHFYDILNPGGFLFLGQSDALWHMSDKFHLVEMGDAFIYKKPSPRTLEGRRFISDRRLRRRPLPAGIKHDRRSGRDRRAQESPPATAALRRHGLSSEQYEAQLKQGRIHFFLGEYHQAVDALTPLAQLERSDAVIHYLLGISHEKLQNLDEAAAAFRRSLDRDPTFGLAHFHLAHMLELSGRLRSALLEYRAAAKNFRDFPNCEWDSELETCNADALLSLCEWKVESLGSIAS